MVKAIARAFRWREMLEEGTYPTIAEIAAAEKINATYVGRVLRLTLLAPDIVEMILNGRLPVRMRQIRTRTEPGESQSGLFCQAETNRIYYDGTLTYHSPDAADPSVTERVITINAGRRILGVRSYKYARATAESAIPGKRTEPHGQSLFQDAHSR